MYYCIYCVYHLIHKYQGRSRAGQTGLKAKAALQILEKCCFFIAALSNEKCNLKHLPK